MIPIAGFVIFIFPFILAVTYPGRNRLHWRTPLLAWNRRQQVRSVLVTAAIIFPVGYSALLYTLDAWQGRVWWMLGYMTIHLLLLPFIRVATINRPY